MYSARFVSYAKRLKTLANGKLAKGHLSEATGHPNTHVFSTSTHTCGLICHAWHKNLSEKRKLKINELYCTLPEIADFCSLYRA